MWKFSHNNSHFKRRIEKFAPKFTWGNYQPSRKQINLPISNHKRSDGTKILLEPIKKCFGEFVKIA